MRLGAMNHPMAEVADEIRKFQAMGFDLIDLTLEPARGLPAALPIPAVRAALAETGLSAVGHTAWYLPIASPFPRVRQAAFDEFRDCFDCFAQLGITLVNLHPDSRVPSMFPREWMIERNIESLHHLVGQAAERGIRLMLENVPGPFNHLTTLTKVLTAVPSLGWHLDVGHANLGSGRNTTSDLLAGLADRLQHVHFSDNKGDADSHLPMGVGTIDWAWAIQTLKKYHFDGTITLEVFSPDQEYLAISRQKVRRLWDSIPANSPSPIAAPG